MDAEIRRCRVNGIDAYLVRRGDEHAGAILIKHNRFEAGCTVYVPTTSPDGGRAWRRGTGDDPLPEGDADAYIARQRGYDPDLWVIEIEDPRGALGTGGAGAAVVRPGCGMRRRAVDRAAAMGQFAIPFDDRFPPVQRCPADPEKETKSCRRTISGCGE